jgi:hypothetical protein
MTRKKPSDTPRPDASFARIVAGAKSEDEQLRALEAAARREIALPAEALVVGEPVVAAAIVYGGQPRAGLTARCERGGRRFSVGLADLAFPPGSPGARFVSLYRAWLGLGEIEQPERVEGAMPAPPPTVTRTELVVGEAVDLVVLACRQNALRCRVLGTSHEVTLRTAVRDEIPGAVLTVTPTKQWTHARHPYVSGDITSTRFDVVALGLTPLALHEEGEWDPDDEYWGEEGDPVPAWAKPIIARGKRPMFEMEQVVPGADPEDFDSDPILEAAELRSAGDRRGAYKLLMGLLAKDLRCLDAHAHLGNLEFDRRPKQAVRHYEVGMMIGAFSLGKDFGGVLPWGLIDNRPFLRCVHGAGLCAWRLGDVRTAKAIFTKMLWLNPSDNQGARFHLAAVQAGKTREEMEGDER